MPRPKGYKHTAETIEKCRVAAAKRPKPRGWIGSVKFRGHNQPHTPEGKKNISIAMKARKPGGDCAVCGKPAVLDQDHNHVTGVLRGKLCSKCNVGLGFFKDNPELLDKAAAYLRRWE